LVPADRAVKAYHKRLVQACEEMKSDPVRVEALEKEMAIVEAYIPKGATKEEVTAYLKTLNLMQPFSEVMKLAKVQFPQDGKLVAETVKELQA